MKIFCPLPIDLGVSNYGMCSQQYGCNNCQLLEEHVKYWKKVAEDKWKKNLNVEWICVGCIEEIEKQTKLYLGFFSDGNCSRCGTETIILNLVLM